MTHLTQTHHHLSTSLLGAASLSVLLHATHLQANELFEAMLLDTEFLEETAANCLLMHEDEYHHSEHCEHAANAIKAFTEREADEASIQRSQLGDEKYQ